MIDNGPHSQVIAPVSETGATLFRSCSLPTAEAPQRIHPPRWLQCLQKSARSALEDSILILYCSHLPTQSETQPPRARRNPCRRNAGLLRLPQILFRRLQAGFHARRRHVVGSLQEKRLLQRGHRLEHTPWLHRRTDRSMQWPQTHTHQCRAKDTSIGNRSSSCHHLPTLPLQIAHLLRIGGFFRFGSQGQAFALNACVVEQSAGQ